MQENRKNKMMEESLKMLAGFRLLDDDFMTVVFDRNIEATELILNIILNRKDMKVLEVTAQREYKSPITICFMRNLKKQSDISRKQKEVEVKCVKQ